ncbi:hypothetical protein ACWIG3_26340 [Streptomyces celluloflavus]|uniref:hypothetical protein n=1 Tax=Streptomyces celluloflavus TaxID=58344 RepID=UPI003696C3FF
MNHFSRPSFRSVGALLTGVVLCGTAACSTSGGKPSDHAGKSEQINASPVAAVQKAVDKGAKLNSFSCRISGKIPGQGKVEGKVSMNLHPRAMEMRMKASGGEEEGEFSVRVVGDALYIGGAEELAAAMQGKHWVKIGMQGKGLGGQSGLGGMQHQADRDPAAQASLLSQSHDVKNIGEETVEGIKTTHYAGAVDVDDLLKKSTAKSPLDATRRAKTVEQYKELGVTTLNLDLWVGPDDRMVKFRERAQAAQGPLDISMRFLDINKPVTVATPPASDTMDLEQKLKERADDADGDI